MGVGNSTQKNRVLLKPVVTNDHGVYTTNIPCEKPPFGEPTYIVKGPLGVMIEVPYDALPGGTIVEITLIDYPDWKEFQASGRINVNTGGVIPSQPVTMILTHWMDSTHSAGFSLLAEGEKGDPVYLGVNDAEIKRGAARKLGYFEFKTSRIGDWVLASIPLFARIQKKMDDIKEWDRFSILPLIESPKSKTLLTEDEYLVKYLLLMGIWISEIL